MARVNYSFQKAERERAKLAKKAAKKSAAADEAVQEPVATDPAPAESDTSSKP